MLNLKKLKKTKKGFTLIELIVVIAIIGILAAILLPRFSGFTDNAREKSIRSEAKNIYTKMEAVYAEKGSYPATTTEIPDIANVMEGDKDSAGKTRAKLTLKTGEQDILFTYEKDNYTATCSKSGKIEVSKNATTK